jgi:MFS family permease
LDYQAEKVIKQREEEISIELADQEESQALNNVTIDQSGHDGVSFADIKLFPKIFWYLCIGTALVQSSILSFDVIGVSYITDKLYPTHNLSKASKLSGEVFSTFRLSSFIFSPILGFLVDRIGHRPFFFTLGCVVTLAAHLLMIILHPVIPCIMFGIGLSLLYTACWPSVMLIVQKENVGTACGLITSCENIGLAVFPIIDGILKNMFGTYDDSEIFLALLALAGTIVGINLYIRDIKEGGTLKNSKQQSIEY